MTLNKKGSRDWLPLQLNDSLVLPALLAGIHFLVGFFNPSLKRKIAEVLSRTDGDGDLDIIAFESKLFVFDLFP